MFFRFVVCCAFVLLSMTAATTGRSNDLTSSNWPGFLGPISSKLSADDVPLRWSPDAGIAWRSDIVGYGQSSPVVWGSKVFVTSISGSMKETCYVTAYDLSDGRRLWQRDFSAAMQVKNTGYTSKAAPTPVADGDGIVAWFEAGNLIALDHNGKTRWIRDLTRDYGKIDTRHGLGGSLAQTEKLVIVWVERQTDPYLVAVDKATGETAWKAEGLKATSWSTPRLLQVGDRQHLVISGSGKLAGLDPATGKRLWLFEGLTGNTIPSPQPIGNGELIVAASAGNSESASGNPAESNGIIRVTADGNGGYEVAFRWKCRRATSSYGSPIVYQGVAYFVNKAGVLYGIDAESGKELFAKRIGDTVWATPLPIGDRIYLAGRQGTTVVIQAGTKFKKIAENQLGTSKPRQAQQPVVQYSIVAVPGCILIRTGKSLYCMRKRR